MKNTKRVIWNSLDTSAYEEIVEDEVCTVLPPEEKVAYVSILIDEYLENERLILNFETAKPLVDIVIDKHGVTVKTVEGNNLQNIFDTTCGRAEFFGKSGEIAAIEYGTDGVRKHLYRTVNGSVDELTNALASAKGVEKAMCEIGARTQSVYNKVAILHGWPHKTTQSYRAACVTVR